MELCHPFKFWLLYGILNFNTCAYADYKSPRGYIPLAWSLRRILVWCENKKYDDGMVHCSDSTTADLFATSWSCISILPLREVFHTLLHSHIRTFFMHDTSIHGSMLTWQQWALWIASTFWYDYTVNMRVRLTFLQVCRCWIWSRWSSCSTYLTSHLSLLPDLANEIFSVRWRRTFPSSTNQYPVLTKNRSASTSKSTKRPAKSSNQPLRHSDAAAQSPQAHTSPPS